MLHPELRARVESDLRWYRDACEEARDLALQLRTLRAPTAPRWSHINSQRGAPGDPTGMRAIRCSALTSRYRAAAWLARTLHAWLWAPERHEDDRLLLALVYGLHRPQCVTLAEAADALDIPCETEAEERAVQEHMDGLLLEVAVALRIVRSGRGAA